MDESHSQGVLYALTLYTYSLKIDYIKNKLRYNYVQRTWWSLTNSKIRRKESYSGSFVILSWDVNILEIFWQILNPLSGIVFENKIKWQKIKIWKNNDKRTIQFQARNIGSNRKIKVQVQNIDSNINSSTTRQKRAKNNLISIKKSEELFASSSTTKSEELFAISWNVTR